MPDATPGLVIVDGAQKSFLLEGTWQAAAAPVVGMTLEVELAPDGSVASIHALDAQKVAIEQGLRVAALSRSALAGAVDRVGKWVLGATAALWIAWFFLPAVDLGLATFTLWDVLGIDTSSAFGMLGGTSHHGLFAALGLAAIAAPLAAPFVKSPRAVWLNAAPLAFLLLLLARLGLGVYQATSAASEMSEQLGGQLNEAMQSMQSAARDAMLKQVLGALGWGLLVVVGASITLFVHALRQRGPLALQGSVAALAAQGGAFTANPANRRGLVLLSVVAAGVAVLIGLVSLGARLFQDPKARAKTLFDDLNATIAGSKGDCDKLGGALKSFFDTRADDFRAIAKLPLETQAELAGELLPAMQKAQLAVGGSFMYCANHREFGAAAVAFRDNFGLVGEGLAQAQAQRSAFASPARAELETATKPSPEAAATKPSLWDRLFGKSAEAEPAKPVAPVSLAAPSPPAPAPVAQAVAAAAAEPAAVAEPPPAAPAPVETASPSAPDARVDVAAPTPPGASASYAVFGVAAGDVLHARQEPTPTAASVFDLAPTARGLSIANRSGSPGNEWFQVTKNGASGWVNRAFLAEERPSPCAQPAVQSLLDSFIQAVQRGDGVQLQSLVSPLHGLQVRLDVALPGAHLKPADLATLFSSPAQQAWSPSRRGAFKDIVLPPLARTLAAPTTQTCGKVAPSTTAAGWPAELQALTPFSIVPRATANDSASWVLGIEHLDGAPKVAAVIEYAPVVAVAPAARPVVAAAPAAPPPAKLVAIAPAAEPVAAEPKARRRHRK
ncbi:MAG TPA: hypothetical protein VEQ59_01225 [Polyangiaceae bacterium]|nr:hypothetical protein [Polyangiaceae bacterium]